MHTYRAICFDFDYTLGDATDSIVADFQYAFGQMGHPIPARETVRGTIGYLLEDAYTMLTGDASQQGRDAFRPLFLSVARARQREETTLFLGADVLLRALQAAGIKVAIVSTKRGDTIQYVMERHALLQTLEFIIGSEEVALPKPDPQGLLLSMARLGVTPEETLFCGDTILDAGAAKHAGCDFVAVLNGTTKAEAFAPFAPRYIATDLPDLMGWLGL